MLEYQIALVLLERDYDKHTTIPLTTLVFDTLDDHAEAIRHFDTLKAALERGLGKAL